MVTSHDRPPAPLLARAVAFSIIAMVSVSATNGRCQAQPAIDVRVGVALIDATSLVPDAQTGLSDIAVAFPKHPPRRLLLAAQPDRSAAGKLLAELRRNEGAGNHGDLYDNRDRGHSALDTRRFPDLSRTVYAAPAQDARLDYGLNASLRFGATVFGNSSTAVTSGALWRSLPRLALTSATAMDRLAALYRANHLYVYPSHKDYQPDGDEDLFPAMSAQMVVSHGSSGSDRRFVEAIASILSALPPDTKALLRREGLIAPTVQMILRRGMDGIDDDAGYMSAAAHPSALAPRGVRRLRMIRLAAALRADSAPPAPVLEVLREPGATPGLGLFGDGLTERLFDTADAIARIARGVIGVRRYRLSAGGTVDPNGRPLRFHWRVLRGETVALEPQGSGGAEADVTIAWAPLAQGGANATPQRVDIAVFADNGVHLSAPAFFSVVFPPRQRRIYDERGAPRSIAYDTVHDGVYADPVLYPRRRWRDDYTYDAEGRLIGWLRTRDDGATESYSRHGLRIVSRDSLGRAQLVKAVRYPLHRATRNGAPLETSVRIEPAGLLLRYVYNDVDDRLGVLTPLRF